MLQRENEHVDGGGAAQKKNDQVSEGAYVSVRHLLCFDYKNLYCPLCTIQNPSVLMIFLAFFSCKV